MNHPALLGGSLRSVRSGIILKDHVAHPLRTCAALDFAQQTLRDRIHRLLFWLWLLGLLGHLCNGITDSLLGSLPASPLQVYEPRLSRGSRHGGLISLLSSVLGIGGNRSGTRKCGSGAQECVSKVRRKHLSSGKQCLGKR